MHPPNTSASRGFSFVEMSIVLIIIGLFVGGTLAGMHLKRAAELKHIVDQYGLFTSAARLFRDKYMYRPGDFPEATRHWGRADSGADPTQNCASPETNFMLGPPTCNGNGDGRVIAGEGGGNAYEAFRFWEHLAAAGMIEGDYTGIRHAPAGLGDAAAPGINIPASKIDGVGWFAGSAYGWLGSVGDCLTGHPFRFDNCYKNFLEVGRQKLGDDPHAPFLTGPEARSIDLKFDDGMPGRGKIIGIRWTDCANAASSADLDASYLPTEESEICALMFLDAF